MHKKKDPYEQIHDGEWFDLDIEAGLDLACCDCGLVHNIRWRARKNKIQMKMTRDKRATAARRRR